MENSIWCLFMKVSSLAAAKELSHRFLLKLDIRDVSGTEVMMAGGEQGGEEVFCYPERCL